MAYYALTKYKVFELGEPIAAYSAAVPVHIDILFALFSALMCVVTFAVSANEELATLVVPMAATMSAAEAAVNALAPFPLSSEPEVNVVAPVPPRATARVPIAIEVAFTYRPDELASKPVCAFTNTPVELEVIPLLARTDNEPVVVIGPPVKPLPDPTELTPPVLDQNVLVPLEVRTCPEEPRPPLALIPFRVVVPSIDKVLLKDTEFVTLRR